MALIIGTPGDFVGNAFTLAAGGNFILPANVVVNASVYGLVANLGTNIITIEGTLIGTDGIDLGGNNSKITITASGVVAGTNDDAIELDAASATINNAGLITGHFGIFDSGAGLITDLITINNTGRIISELDSIRHSGVHKMVLTNSGTIQSYDDDAFSSGATAVSVVINKGSMFGDVALGGGADIYDGRGGRVVGIIYGGTEADKLTGGDLVDTMDGGAGIDILTGGKGKDILSGGVDVVADKFHFNSNLEVGDVISDFTTADFIVIKSSAFGNVAVGASLAAAAFRANTTGLAGDASDRFIYETDSDRLWYDSNGNVAGGVKLMVADFVGDVNFTRGEIMVI